MEITYLGHSSFKLKSKAGFVVISDPFDPKMVGTNFAKDVADVVTVSHSHKDHSDLSSITGAVNRSETFVIDKEGEYEIAGVMVTALKTYHDKTNGSDRGTNLVTAVVMDGVNIVHLGDLGHKLSEGQREKLGSVDILCIPVGGGYTIDSEEATALIKDIQPSLVIPMHYKTESSTTEFSGLDGVEKFLEKSKLPKFGETVHKIKLDSGDMPDDTQVLLMNA